MDDGEPRQRQKWYVNLADFANMMKAFIGSNYLTIAFAFRQSGLIPGIVGLVVIAIATDHCCGLIVKGKNAAIRTVLKNLESDGVLPDDEDFIQQLKKKLKRNLSYGDVGKISYGSAGLMVVNFCIFITQFGFCIGYFIFLGNSIQALFLVRDCYVLNGTVSCSDGEKSVLTRSLRAEEDLYNSTLFQSINSSDYLESVMNYSLPDQELFSTELDKNETVKNMTQLHAYESTAPDLRFLVLIPLPVFIAFSYLRKIRHLGAVSMWANLSIFVGAISVMGYLFSAIKLSPSYNLYNWSTLPIFFGMVTGAYEGAGMIIPIESSMEGNRHNFRPFLHGAIAILSFILAAFGILGYLEFGDQTRQMINANIPNASWISITVNILLCVGVILTFPLQVFPVIELAEIYTCGDGRICGPKKKRLRHDDDDDYGSTNYNDHESLLPQEDLASSLVPVATVISSEVSTMKRNAMRFFLVLMACGIAVVSRNYYAYIGAFAGAIGSSLLAYILPCLFHMKLCWSELPNYVVVKDVIIIIAGIGCSIASLYTTIKSIIDGV